MTIHARVAGVRCLPLPRVDDLAALDAALRARRPAARDVVALLAKTQGDGGPADRSRAIFVAAARRCLARHLGIGAAQVDARVAFVVSGGIEASAAPHMIVLSRREVAGAVKGKALAIGRHVSAPLGATSVARAGQIEAAAASVRAALRDGGMKPADAHLVLIKGPAGDGAAGIARARAATALGASVALGELGLAAARTAWRRRDLATWSARVAVSSAAEFPCDEVVVLGHAAGWGGALRIAHRAMADLIDLKSVVAALAELGLAAAPQLSRHARARLVASIAKGGPPPDEMLRGVPMGLASDASQPAFRRVRGALAGTIVAATGVPFAFVSGGAEHQGPPGGGLVAFVARKKPSP
ncbi:MAG: cyanuric acid amidohydrolase [Proteobacteria bacterium]|nr:cyanuric acid amidohydrolase [Pseudomonadota bacterium]